MDQVILKAQSDVAAHLGVLCVVLGFRVWGLWFGV